MPNTPRSRAESQGALHELNARRLQPVVQAFSIQFSNTRQIKKQYSITKENSAEMRGCVFIIYNLKASVDNAFSLWPPS